MAVSCELLDFPKLENVAKRSGQRCGTYCDLAAVKIGGKWCSARRLSVLSRGTVGLWLGILWGLQERGRKMKWGRLQVWRLLKSRKSSKSRDHCYLDNHQLQQAWKARLFAGL